VIRVIACAAVKKSAHGIGCTKAFLVAYVLRVTEDFNENERAYLKEKAIKHYIEPWKENQKERGRINIRLKGGGEGGKITSAWSEGVHLQITGADVRRLRSEICLQFPLCDIFCQLGS